MGHPYWQSAKAEQRQEAIEKYREEALRYIETQPRPITGRVLETVS